MTGTQRTARRNSNVFHSLTKSQIVQLREAFGLLDTDGNSRLSVEDLTTFLESIGTPYSQEVIEEMVEELKPNCNFMMLLTCIGEKMGEISTEKEITGWLKLFDEDGDGLIESAVLKHWMTEEEDGMDPSDYEYLVRGCVENGMVDYRKLASKMKHGEILGREESVRVQNVE